jgi:prepilin-type N-terminal cleavage/methylation domain-containing protein/prepilin-type processing-associated H-X9-DG protein
MLIARKVRTLMYRRPPQRHAFTLVELLVVLAIITLLLTMLLPALREAREQANGIKCAASLRQMYAAVTMYGNDHRGYLPAARFWDNRLNSATPILYWHDALERYLQPKNTRHESEARQSGQPVIEQDWKRNSVIWQGCPNWEPGEYESGPGYGYNFYPHDPEDGPSMWIDMANWAPFNNGRYHKLTEITHRNERALIADARSSVMMSYGPWDHAKPLDWQRPGTVDVQRHGDPRGAACVNVLFFDGHARAASFRDVLYALIDPMRTGQLSREVSRR